MATIKQKKAIENLVGNGGNVTKAMRDAGYKEGTINTPQRLTESKGYLELLDEYGLTEDLLVTSLVKDIKAKEGNRKPELELGMKARSMLVERHDITSGGFSLTALCEAAIDKAK